MTLRERVRALIVQHGGVRAAARALQIDPAYLVRLRDGVKQHPGREIQQKLGLTVPSPEWLQQTIDAHLLPTLQLVYRKHVLNDDRIGWIELSDAVMHALCEAMGDDGFVQWLQRQREEGLCS